jgi:Na+-translocating ferredoxin:NAD+ oxidoreductase subunit G
MAKAESTLKNILLSLTLISMGASVALGFVYEYTKGPIEISNLNRKLEAIRQVVPDFNNNPADEMFKLASEDGDSIEIYPSRKDNIVNGYAVRTYSDKGYSGKVILMVGFKTDGTIYNISVLDQKETPGLGTKMTEPKFREQFNGKNPESFTLKVKKDGGQVDAISAATISSRAFCDAVSKANKTFRKGVLK